MVASSRQFAPDLRDSARAARMGCVNIRHLYLAGPDVFRPDAAEYGRHLVALCAEHGFVGVFPLNTSIAEHPADPRAAAVQIYKTNIAQIDACDAVLANLDFFRGPEPDSGTCFEVGYAIARGKPVVGYVPEPGSFAERIGRRHPEALGEGGQDAWGWRVEEFGLPLNLMLGASCRIVTGDVRRALEVLRAGAAA